MVSKMRDMISGIVERSIYRVLSSREFRDDLFDRVIVQADREIAALVKSGRIAEDVEVETQRPAGEVKA